MKPPKAPLDAMKGAGGICTEVLVNNYAVCKKSINK